MKTINKVTGVILTVSLMLVSGVIVANDKKVENESTENAQAIEKSDIKRGMPIAEPKPQQAGDPIPGIDITVNQGHSVCQSGSEGCEDGNESVDHVAQQRGGVKFKAGKALADTVKSVDDGVKHVDDDVKHVDDDVKHVDEDSDDDGLSEQ
ncbi:hypothetical protein [Kangiella aquimarina]|uniref:Secreted protein n=1 Tax=Kangiella aquimarina TaxID=261965 RepID=A0ABZ0X4T6_9GAMM|nr:hypothetical protein [Kangiella aquimarina]WQG85573.1 hypothetical protein SR900_01515 [Kangiella aquimarina]